MSASPEMSEIDKIKALHAARRSRRARPPLPPSSSVLSPSQPSDEARAEDEPTAVDTDAAEGGLDDEASRLQKQHKKETDELKQELSTLRVELSSLRRNNIQNIKKITDERDMFAIELAKQQSEPKAGVPSSKKLADVEAQLRAARTRNADLEEENTALRNEVKQLNFRVQASKTLDAASDGYNQVVDELVDAKLKCAQFQEEKEDLLRINKELTTTSAVLRDAMGELEKSRNEWVVQCADVEKQRTQLEERLQHNGNTKAKNVNEASSYSGSDLQELKL